MNQKSKTTKARDKCHHSDTQRENNGEIERERERARAREKERDRERERERSSTDLGLIDDLNGRREVEGVGEGDTEHSAVQDDLHTDEARGFIGVSEKNTMKN